MRWRNVKDILYPDEDLNRYPPLVIPACYSHSFPQACQSAWAERVMLPWIQDHYRQLYGVNVTDFPDDQILPDHYDIYPDDFTPIKRDIERVLYPALLALAAIGSIPCIIILLKFSSTVLSTCLYLAIFVLVDILKLIVHCGNAWYMAVYEQDITYMLLVTSDSVCKVLTFLMYFLVYMSSWAIAAAAIEVVIMVVFPTRLYRMCTRDRANAVVLLITVLLTFINLHYFWTWALTEQAEMMEYQIDQPMCYPNRMDQSSEEFTNNIAPVIEFLIANLFPFLIVCVSVILVVTNKYVIRKQKECETEALLGKYFMDTVAILEMERVILAISVWYIIVQGYDIVIQMLSRFVDPKSLDPTVISVLNFMEEIMKYLFYSFKPWLFFLLSRKVRLMVDGALKWLLQRCGKVTTNLKVPERTVQTSRYVSEV